MKKFNVRISDGSSFVEYDIVCNGIPCSDGVAFATVSKGTIANSIASPLARLQGVSMRFIKRGEG